MEILEMTKARLKWASKGFTSIMVMFFIVLPVLFTVSIMSSNSKFDLSAELEAQNASDLTYESLQRTSIPDDSLVNRFDKKSDLNYESSQPTETPNNKMLDGDFAPRIDEVPVSEHKSPGFNRSRAPSFIGGSVSNSEPTGIHEEDQFDGIPAPTSGEKTSSTNNSPRSVIIVDDKLLDGLISPKSDERSCLSRYQSILYRRISPHKPSPFLLSKLRNYENLHKRCGPYTKSYYKTLKGLEKSHKNRTIVCKYIIWRPTNGLGNRMISMASSFLYALLTNRVLLLHQGTDMADLFCEPFPSTSWLLPTDFPLKNQIRKSELRYAHSLEGMLEKESINKLMESAPSYLYLALQKRDFVDKKFFYCEKGQALLKKIPWLILLSEQYFAPSFFLMPSFQEEVSKMFPDKETVFHHLGRYLFNPSNQIWNRLITGFYDSYLAKADERIGLQIRVYHANAKMFRIVMDQILSCTLKKKILPKVESSGSLTSSKAILVTSLYTEFHKNLSEMYTGELIRAYQPSHEEYQHRGDNLHNMKAWAEMYLLSLCDVLVTSAWSTFGYVAQGLGGLRPWILHRPGTGIYLPCKRAGSMEPCFHYPFGYDCESENKINVSSLVPYIRKCEDRELGVKLFNRN